MFAALLDIARRIAEPLNSLVEHFPNRVAGVVLEIDEYWLARARWREYLDGPWRWSLPREPRLDFDAIWRMTFGIKLDMGYRPPDWSDYCRNRGIPQEGSPVIIKILLREPSDFKTMELPRSLQEYAVRYEYRGTARAIGAAAYLQTMIASSVERVAPAGDRGVRVHPSGKKKHSGTLGGLLEDVHSGELYGVTCSHVVGKVGRAVELPSWWRRPIGPYTGTVYRSSSPPVKDLATKCNRIALPRPSIDAALITTTANPRELLSLFQKVHRVRPEEEMQQGDPVEFNGWASGRKLGELRNLVVWREVEVDDLPRCYGHMMEIRPRDKMYVVEVLARPGDSGSWVVSHLGGVTSWDGMIAVVDDLMTYALFSSDILETFRHLPDEVRLP